MKLSLGDNIRRLRRARDLTQEQLADRLGVTYQSVSRWEVGTAYPDIELLPAISDIFSVSVDELLGVPETEREKQANALCEEFRSLRNKSVSEAKREEWMKSLADIVRKLRVDYAGCCVVGKFWLNGYDWILRQEPILSEVRLLAQACLEKRPDHTDVIDIMAVIEDDEHLDEFLKRYTTEQNVSRDEVLLNRYVRRDEPQKASPLKQQKLFEFIDSSISSTIINFFPSHSGDVEQAYAINTAKLGILHAFTEETPTPENPITCGKDVDFWAEERIGLGLLRTSYLSGMGKVEEAFVVLEDTISLLERVMQITDRIELPTSRFTPDIKWTAVEMWDKGWFKSEEHPRRLEREVWITSSNNYWYGVSPSVVLRQLTVPSGWMWYDTLRNDSWFEAVMNDPRYQNYIERVQRLVLTKDEDEPAQ